MLLGQCVEHGQNGRRADPGADQQDRRVGVVEDEGASRRCDVELVAHDDSAVQVAAGGAVTFVLDRDAVVAGAGWPGKGVVAQHGPLLGVRLEAQSEVLARACCRERLLARGFQSDGDHGGGLPLDSGHGQAAETGPGGGRARLDQARVAAAGLFFQESAERGLPAGAEGGNAQRAKQLLTRVPGEVEERVELGDAHVRGARCELENLVSGLDLSLLEHAEVEAGSMVRDEQRRHARVVHPDSDAVAGDARLSDLEDGAADLVAVANADLVVTQAVDREVLAELAVDEVVSTKLAFPVAVGVDLVHEHGALLAAVSGPVALPVAGDVQPAHAPRPGDGVLVDPGEDRPAAPERVLRHADVDRQQSADGVADAHASAVTPSSTSWMPPISSTLRLRSGPCGRTFWPGAASSFSPSIVIVSFSG